MNFKLLLKITKLVNEFKALTLPQFVCVYIYKKVTHKFKINFDLLLSNIIENIFSISLYFKKLFLENNNQIMLELF